MIGMLRRVSILFCAASLLLPLVACKPKDPQEDLLAERAGWEVSLTRWFPADDSIQLALRIKNPRDATLETLTVQVQFLDEKNDELAQLWVPVNVADFRRGIPEDRLVTITPPDIEFAGISVLLVPFPDEEQRKHLGELQATNSTGS